MKYNITDILDVMSDSSSDSMFINHPQLFTESYIFSRNDYEINLNKWKPGVPLWITGTSGDGKSTLALRMAQAHDALIVPTDLVLCRLKWSKEKWEKRQKTSKMLNDPVYQLAVEFIKKQHSWPYEIADSMTPMSDLDVAKYYKEFFEYVIEQNNINPKYNNKKIIIEGCDICFTTDPEYMSKQPLIIIGCSRLKASLQRIKRDHKDDNHSLIKSIFREIYRYNKYVNKLDKNKDTFLKDILKYLN